MFAPVDKDIAKGVRIEKGDYVVSALAERMNTTELVGDVVRGLAAATARAGARWPSQSMSRIPSTFEMSSFPCRRPRRAS